VQVLNMGFTQTTCLRCGFSIQHPQGKTWDKCPLCGISWAPKSDKGKLDLKHDENLMWGGEKKKTRGKKK